jgi:hypothetical protein
MRSSVLVNISLIFLIFVVIYLNVLLFFVIIFLEVVHILLIESAYYYLFEYFYFLRFANYSSDIYFLFL